MASCDKKTACVTGGDGYIASALIKLLLEKGYAVKTTMRNHGPLNCLATIPDDMETNSHLKDLQALGPLEIFRAELDEEGSFDEAVAGCNYAFLVTAPVNLKSENPEEEMIQLAVRGTLNVMRSCVKAGTVKRVILTSSVVAVSSKPLQGDGHVLDEGSWADVDYLRECGSAWSYAISKVLLEEEACKFAQEKGISLVTVCPAGTVGAAPAAKISTSVPVTLSLLSGDEAMIGILKSTDEVCGSLPLVHVEDLCHAEIFVAEEESASGRYICCSLNTTAMEIARFLEENYPQYNVKANCASLGDLPEKARVCISSAKLLRQGFKYKYNTLPGLYQDLIEYGKAMGILQY